MRKDAQRTLFKLAKLEGQRVKLVKGANEAWMAGRKAQAKKLARKVVEIEGRMKKLLSG